MKKVSTIKFQFLKKSPPLNNNQSNRNRAKNSFDKFGASGYGTGRITETTAQDNT